MKNTQKAFLIATLLASYSIAQAGGMNFKTMDADNNGTVSEQEFYDAKNKRIAERAKEGRQMRGLANAPSFADIDANQDGQLTPVEMKSMKQARGMRGKGGMGKGNRQMNKPAWPVFADFDANKDNELTEQEFYDARNKRIAKRAKEGRQMRGLANAPAFSDIDSNHDGFVNAQEFSSFRGNRQPKNH